MTDRPLTAKEHLVIETFDKLRPGTGDIAKRTILNPNTGWAEMIEAMTEEEITLNGTLANQSVTTSTNSFMYSRIG
jgi:hypothetical protein